MRSLKRLKLFFYRPPLPLYPAWCSGLKPKRGWLVLFSSGDKKRGHVTSLWNGSIYCSNQPTIPLPCVLLDRKYRAVPAQPGGSLLSFPIPEPSPRQGSLHPYKMFWMIFFNGVRRKMSLLCYTAPARPVAEWNASRFISQINNFTAHQAQCKHSSWRTTACTPHTRIHTHAWAACFFPPVRSNIWQSELLTSRSESTEMELLHGPLHRTPPKPSATNRLHSPPLPLQIEIN